ncbi:MAG: hypothetical protein CMG62_07550 [Candidatus Marinimicrobia bacterium]|nr:hypothetical protein [Candidatus Neomarinimicrobiota bacterium]
MKDFLKIFLITSSLSFSKTGLEFETYKLKNGLTVMLNPDNNASTVFGGIIIKGGAKQDPPDATGIAHYLEHMLFNGTTELGTIDYKSEKVFLDSIEIQYELLGKTKDEKDRNRIQKKINDLSIKASRYAIPNEFSKIIEGFGGTGVNAFTNQDIIGYISSFPNHQMTKWLNINSHRFQEPVFRMFQSELEIVYEEKNRAMDNTFRNVFQDYFRNFFKNHPYGQQLVIGTAEHLKNPSLKIMKDYYDTYYVANNMYLALSGNFDPNIIKPIIQETFGKLESGPEPDFVRINEDSFKGRELVKKRMTPIRFGIIGYRVPPGSHEDSEIIQVIGSLFNNSSSTGLLDRLSIENKLLGSQAINGFGGADHGAVAFFFVPKLIFQTFRGAEKLVLEEIQKVKTGGFDDEFLESIKLMMIQAHESTLESQETRLQYALQMIYDNKSWQDILDYPSKINSITKQDIIRVANKYFQNNYLVFQSKIGFPKKTKLDKPPYKPIKPINADSKSSYASKIDEMDEGKIILNAIDFNKDISYDNLGTNWHLYHAKNPMNSIFTKRLEYGIGEREKPDLKYAAMLGNMIGNKNLTFNQFKEELQEYGATVNFFCEKNYFGVDIRGFDKHYKKTMEMVGHFFNTMTIRKEDKKKLKKLIQESTIERRFEAREPQVKGNALRDYALYGKNSYFLRRSSIKDVKSMKTDYLLEQIKDAMEVELSIFYTGSLEKDYVKNVIKSNLNIKNKLKPSNSPVIDELKLKDSNTIYFYNDKKAIQSQLYILLEGEEMNMDDRNLALAFNKYFSGRGLIFQEIREFRSLAYSAYGSYRNPYYTSGKGYFQGYVGTQSDKTIDALDAYISILNDMPERESWIEGIKNGLEQSQNSKKPNFRSIAKTIRNWKHQGFAEDPRIAQNKLFKSLDFNDLTEFYQKYLKNRPLTITVVGNKEKIDMEKLATYGKIIEVDKKKIFN